MLNPEKIDQTYFRISHNSLILLRCLLQRSVEPPVLSKKAATSSGLQQIFIMPPSTTSCPVTKPESSLVRNGTGPAISWGICDALDGLPLYRRVDTVLRKSVCPGCLYECRRNGVHGDPEVAEIVRETSREANRSHLACHVMAQPRSRRSNRI